MTFAYHIKAHDLGGPASYDPHDGSGHYDPEFEFHLIAKSADQEWEYFRCYSSRIAAELALSNITDADLNPKDQPELWCEMRAVK